VTVDGKVLTITTDNVLESNFDTRFTILLENEIGNATSEFIIQPKG